MRGSDRASPDSALFIRTWYTTALLASLSIRGMSADSKYVSAEATQRFNGAHYSATSGERTCVHGLRAIDGGAGQRTGRDAVHLAAVIFPVNKSATTVISPFVKVGNHLHAQSGMKTATSEGSQR
jgi:hypothetical protein